MLKNVASQKLTVLAFADAGHATLDAGEKVTGDAANISLKIEQDDDGVRTASNDVAPTETEDGQYVFDLTQAETNGDKLTFYPESSTAGVQVVALPSSVIYTRPQYFADLTLQSDGELHVDATKISGDSTAADKLKAAAKLIVTGTVDTGTTAATTTQFNTSLTTDEEYEGRTLVFGSGAANEALPVKIVNAVLDGTELQFTVEDHAGDPMPNVPINTDPFVII